MTETRSIVYRDDCACQADNPTEVQRGPCNKVCARVWYRLRHRSLRPSDAMGTNFASSSKSFQPIWTQDPAKALLTVSRRSTGRLVYVFCSRRDDLRQAL